MLIHGKSSMKDNISFKSFCYSSIFVLKFNFHFIPHLFSCNKLVKLWFLFIIMVFWFLLKCRLSSRVWWIEIVWCDRDHTDLLSGDISKKIWVIFPKSFCGVQPWPYCFQPFLQQCWVWHKLVFIIAVLGAFMTSLYVNHITGFSNK